MTAFTDADGVFHASRPRAAARSTAVAFCVFAPDIRRARRDGIQDVVLAFAFARRR